MRVPYRLRARSPRRVAAHSRRLARASFLAARHRVFSSGPVFCVSERVSSRYFGSASGPLQAFFNSIIESPANTACLGGFTEALASFTACVTVGGTTRLFQTPATASIESVPDAEKSKARYTRTWFPGLCVAASELSLGETTYEGRGGAGVRVKQAPRRPRKEIHD